MAPAAGWFHVRTLGTDLRILADEETVGESQRASVRYWLLALAIALAVITLPGRTQPAQSNLMLRIGPECVIVNAATTLTDHPDDGMLSGVTTFTYKLRSSRAGGAAIQLALDRPGVPFNYV